MAARVILICFSLFGIGLAGTVWPAPTVLDQRTCAPGTPYQILDSHFRIAVAKSSQHSDILNFAVSTYTDILEAMSAGTTGNINSIVVSVNSSDTSLSTSTDTSYSINYTSATATFTINAVTAFGAQYGLETVAQLLENGGFNCSDIYMVDAPQFTRRVLFLDVAHRFFPIDTLQTIIKGMAYTKINVLNMHFGDTGAVRVTSKTYGGIADGTNGFYTPDDVTTLVAFARNYGVIVVPSVSIPDHADGFSGIDAVKFCADSTELYNDPDGNTLKAITKYVSETSANFGTPHYFIGAGQATASAPCDQDSFNKLTSSVASYLLSAGSAVGAYASVTDIGLAPTSSVHVFAHATDAAGASVQKLLTDGWGVVYAGINHSYSLNTLPDGQAACSDTWQSCLFNNLTQFTQGAEGVLGAVASVWTINYCNAQGCLGGSPANPFPSRFMSSRDQDDVFGTSIVALTFPKAAIVGGSAWNNQRPTDQQLSAAYDAIAARLIARGVGACTCGTCSEAGGCAGAYVSDSPSIPTVQGGMAFAITLLCSLVVLILVSLFYKGSSPRSGYTRVN